MAETPSLHRSDNPIQHVSDTAYWIAAYRAIESARRDALFRDPLASILAKERGQTIASRMKNRKAMAWSVAIRTIVIDELVQAALRQGVELVVNLGAGLDTRPYRLPLPESLLWVEVDFGPILEEKENTLRNDKPACRLERRAIDLSNSSARHQLLGELNSLGRKTLVLTEGVVPYLSNEDVGALARDLASQPQFRYWIIDYFSPMFMEMHRKSPTGKVLKENAPFKFSPPDWKSFFSQTGWSANEFHYLVEEGERRGRSGPAPFIFKLIFPFLPLRKKIALRQMIGYVMLERTP